MTVKKRSVNRVCLYLIWTLTACEINPGIISIEDSPPANGILLFQGGFISPSNISGGAQIYTVNGLVVIFLENYLAPMGSRLTLFLETTSNDAFFRTTLKSFSGSHMYSTGLPFSSDGEVFTRVSIRKDSSSRSTLFGTAYLFTVSY